MSYETFGDCIWKAFSEPCGHGLNLILEGEVKRIRMPTASSAIGTSAPFSGKSFYALLSGDEALLTESINSSTCGTSYIDLVFWSILVVVIGVILAASGAKYYCIKKQRATTEWEEMKTKQKTIISKDQVARALDVRKKELEVRRRFKPVSYTHLTLPTIYSV